MSIAGSLATALTGQSLPITDGAATVDQILAELADQGWDAQKIQDHATDRRRTEQPWPQPIPTAALHEIGPARWYALLAQATHRLGLDGDPQPPSRRTRLTQDEQRLMADRPPHFGSVG